MRGFYHDSAGSATNTGDHCRWCRLWVQPYGARAYLNGISIIDAGIGERFWRAYENDDQKAIRFVLERLEAPFFERCVAKYGWHRTNKALLQAAGYMHRRDRMPLKHISDEEFVLVQAVYREIVSAWNGQREERSSYNVPAIGIKAFLHRTSSRETAWWTLSACVESAKTEAVILSTDSMEYWKIAQEHVRSDKLVLDYRNPDEAGDNVKIFDYLKGSQTKVFGNRKGAFILALPTVPLRRSRHIDEAIAQFERQGVPVFSATNYGFPISFAFHLKADGVNAVFEETDGDRKYPQPEPEGSLSPMVEFMFEIIRAWAC
jgi:hypothetical protein